MDFLRWVAPALLAIVMAIAAGAKLAAPDATRGSFAALGLPAPMILAIVVPALELVTAVALILSLKHI